MNELKNERIKELKIMKTNILHNMINNVRVYAMMACLMMLGVGNVWGADETLTVTGSVIGSGSGYGSGTGNINTTASTSIGLSWANVLKGQSYIQMKASTGELHSTSYPSTNNKIKTIKVTVTAGTVQLYGSTDGSSWSSSIEFTSGTAVNVSSSNYKYFKITSTASYATASSVEVVYTASTPQTVTFMKEGGTFDDESVFTRTTPSYQIDEASGGAGITLPHASPSAACTSEGWEFAGWAASACSETTTGPILIGKAGDKYYPESAVTLHAVYRKLTDGETATPITFNASTLSGLTEIDEDYWRHTSSNIEFWLGCYGLYSSTFDIDATDAYCDASVGYAFIDSPYRIKQVTLTVNSGYLLGSVTPDAGSATLTTSSTTHTINCSGNVTYLKLEPNTTNNEAQITTFSVTYYNTTFNSNPSCCEYEVSVSESGSSHLAAVDGMTFSSSSVATCGDAASRTITITVTPASGYTLFGDTKPVFTKTSGTVAATIGSVTDNGNGTFSYECTFASNNDGAGTFAISPGQFTNYRTLCCTKYDITLASSGSKTGGSFEVDPAKACEGTEITLMATPDDGYEFSAWTITDDGDDDVTTTVLGSGNEDEDAVEFEMPAYNITIDAEFACTTPTISVQPSGASYTQNESATALSVTASAGTGTVDYQWQSSSDNSSWDDIDDETSSTYTPSTTSTGTTYYRVVVTNHECSASRNSSSAAIVVSAASVCATPTFSVAAGTYSSAQSVSLSCKTDGATIRYTTNGDDPTESSSAYSSAISVSVNTTIKAKAFKGGMTPSSVASATYNIRCAAPTFSLDEDIYVGSQSLTMSSATTGATVRYTTDESEPTGSSTAYSSALTVSTSTTYKAKAYKDGMTESEESEVYVMIQCATPTFSVSAGTYNANQSVSISTTYGTTIYYTLDGSTPDTKSSTYSSAITIDATKTLKAIAVKSGCEDSDVASATYTLKCATPTFSPVAGTYTGAQSVSMSCATTGSAIHYTTNGTDPTGSSATYSSAISVGTNQTVKAIATKTGWSDSEVASAAYTIKYNVAVASVDNVTISATTPSVAEGSSAAAAYGSTVSLSYSGVASGKTWGGWNVYKTGDASTTVTVTSNQFTMPAYNVTVSAIIFGAGIAWCDPDVTVTGDVHLTSYNGVPVYSTEDAENLISISSSDFGSATRLDVAYLDADNSDTEVDKAESVFRLCNDGSVNYDPIDGLDLDYEWGTTHSVRYTPNAYDQRDNYKLQFTLKHGDKVLKTVTHSIYGRALPEEFVIASKYNGHWYALPNTIGTTLEDVTPIQITVDDATTPTEASYAPTTTVYKGAVRYRPASNVNSMRFTSTGSNWLETGSTSQLKLSTTASPAVSVENKQVWYLKSSDFGAYTLRMDPAQSPGDKQLGIHKTSGKMGMFAAVNVLTAGDIYLLPIDTKYTPIDATATDWMKDIIGVTASTTANKLGIAQEDGTETDPVDLASVATSHVADFDGDIDFTGLTGEKLLLKWYDGSTLVGGSQVTVPKIILAGSNTTWSALETAVGSATTINDYVVLSKPMTVNQVAKAKRIEIDKSGDNTGSLEISAGKELVVAEAVRKYDGSSFGSTAISDLYIGSDAANGNGALVVGSESTDTKAGVAFYTKARKEGGYVNQFIGVPLAEMTAYDGFYGMYVYGYDAEADKWKSVSNNGAMYPFTAYNLLRKEADATTLYMEGILNLPGTSGTKTLVMTRRSAEVEESKKSDNLFANSWVAPIDIKSMETADFTGADATIYLFTAGTKAQYDVVGSVGDPGQWITLPVEDVHDNPGSYVLTVIPSMEAFMVKATGTVGSEGDHKLVLDYKKHVYDPAVAGSAAVVPNRAPRRAAAEHAGQRLRIRVKGESGNGDVLMIHEREDFSTGFDNGWEGTKIMGSEFAPQMYAMSEDGKMAIAAIPDMEGTVIGFKAGTEDDNYTFTFDYDEEAEEIYLLDIQTGVYTRVTKENSYAFFADDKEEHNRFILTRNAPGVLTGINEVQSDKDPAKGVFKFIENDKMYILYRGVLYDATGKRVSIINR